MTNNKIKSIESDEFIQSVRPWLISILATHDEILECCKQATENEADCEYYLQRAAIHFATKAGV